MRIAFYAPMKPPDHPQPSGDRAIARALLTALRFAGHDARVVSRFASRDGTGNPQRQAAIAAHGTAVAEILVKQLAGTVDLWFTYHLYHKAPDHLGPAVSRALGIPYVIAEASYAPKQATGPWRDGHAAVAAAVGQAAAVITLNPEDLPCLRPLLASPRRLVLLPPFVADPEPPRRLPQARRRLASCYAIDPNAVWLAAVAMLRPGDKQTSYAHLAVAMRHLPPVPWHLLIAGSGPAGSAIASRLNAAAGHRVTFLGALPPPRLADLYAAADAAVWPAHREAIAMALLEAQVAGLPVVAGASGAIPSFVTPAGAAPGGIVTPPGDIAAFGRATSRIVARPALRMRLARNARRNAFRHFLPAAARRLDAILRSVVTAE